MVATDQKVICAIMILGTTRQTVSATAWSLTGSTQALFAANRTIETICCEHHQVRYLESPYKPSSEDCFCLLLLLEELPFGYSEKAVFDL